MKTTSRPNSIANTRPDLAVQWHPHQNGDLTPETVTVGSSRKIWWECTNGHEWQAMPFNRAKFPNCPTCRPRTGARKGTPSLGEAHPELIEYLHPTKNADNSAIAENSSRSKVRVWWLLACGHETFRSPFERNAVKYPNLCPACAKVHVSGRSWELRSTIADRSDLMELWDVGANPGIDPSTLTVNDRTIANWRCSKGHTFTLMVRRMVSDPGCRGCRTANTAIMLADVRPEAAKWWHPTRNGDVTFDMVTAHSGLRWWRCGSGHVWQTEARHIASGSGCPTCHKKRVAKTNNRPGHKPPNPDLVLHLTLNRDRQKVTSRMYSREKAWFVCVNSHTFEMTMANYTIGVSCPVCDGRQPQLPLP